MTVCNRLQELVTFSTLSNRAFALKCGLKQATFDKQIREVRTLSMETVEAVLNTFVDVSAEWLIRGEGKMLRGDHPQPATLDYYERANKLVDTITLLQDTINGNAKTIRLLEEQIQQLKNR